MVAWGARRRPVPPYPGRLLNSKDGLRLASHRRVPARAPGRAHRHHRRRHGHDDPAREAGRGGLPRRALRATTRKDLKGNNDLLSLTRPDIIEKIHRQYLRGRRRHHRDQHLHRDLHLAGRLRPGGPGLRAERGRGASGPAGRGRRDGRGTGTSAPGWRDRSAPRPGPPRCRGTSTTPGRAHVTFDELVAATTSRRAGSWTAAPTSCCVETVFDTLNSKAALFAIERLFDERGRRVPVMACVTITGSAPAATSRARRSEAFWNSVSHIPSARRGHQLRARREADEAVPRGAASASRPLLVSCYPNAGLPNAFWRLRRDARDAWPRTSASSRESGLLNIVGGCCGTTPEHIRAIAAAVAGPAPRVPAQGRALPAPLRPRAADPPPRHELRERRRAHERHRLAEASPS